MPTKSPSLGNHGLYISRSFKETWSTTKKLVQLTSQMTIHVLLPGASIILGVCIDLSHVSSCRMLKRCVLEGQDYLIKLIIFTAFSRRSCGCGEQNPNSSLVSSLLLHHKSKASTLRRAMPRLSVTGFVTVRLPEASRRPHASPLEYCWARGARRLEGGPRPGRAGRAGVAEPVSPPRPGTWAFQEASDQLTPADHFPAV